MSIDDDAERMEQLDRDVCLKQRHPEERHTGFCFECGAVSPDYTDTDGKVKKAAFCSFTCSKQYEQANRFNKGREA